MPEEEAKSEDEKDSELTKFKSESQLAGGFVQGIAQALIQWMPVGGSGAVFLTFLLQQNWLMAIVIFPVTVITVFWATFTGGLLSKIQEIAKSMGEESGTFLGKWLRAILEGILWQLIRTEANYLKCQGLEVSQSKTEGLSTFKPSLKDVFIPLELSGEFWRSPDGHNLPMPMGFHSVQEVSEFLEKSNEFRIWDILRICPRNSGDRSIVIQAWGGYGKTTLLRHVTYIYCHQLYRKAPYSTRQGKVPKLLPVLLPFRQWQETIYNEKPDLPTLIEKFHIPSLPGGNDLSFRRDWWAKYWLNQQLGMLIMFDGFDEVKEERRSFISQWIGRQIQKFPNAVFIVTSRPTAYRLHFDSESKLSLPFWVKPLNKEQQESFIQRWYLSYEKHISVRTEHPQVITTEANRNTQELLKQLQERLELNDLAKNPLMLAIMVNLHASYRGAALPDRRVDLYRDIIRLQLGDRPLAKKIDLLLPLQESQRVLQKLALFMVLESRYAIDHNFLLQQLQKILDQYNLSVNNQAFLQQMEEVSELLVKVDRDYEFAHRHFQSYLAVCEIIETKQENLLLTNWSDTEWKETLMMYASLAYSTQLISDLLTLKQQAATDLAYECLQCLKAANRRIDPALEQAMTTLQSTVENSLYQQLESYLKNSQWREADKETDRLMLQIVGKEATRLWLRADQWFSIEDIENFPCKHLRAIDKLWVDYSQGKFGFSVQKKVWMDCGGVPGKYDCDLYDWDVYEKFADQVGWVRSGNYVSHNFLLEGSKHAHLPSRFGYIPNRFKSRWGRRDLGGQAGFWKIFFYRVATCNL